MTDPEDLIARFPPCMNCGHFRGSHQAGGCIVIFCSGPPDDRIETPCGCTQFVGTP